MDIKKQAALLLAVAAIALGCSKSTNQTQTQSTSTPTGTTVTPNWTSAALFGSYTDGAYYVTNDVWGTSPGPQTIWVVNHASWGITSLQLGGGIKSYAHVGKTINQPIHSFSTITSAWAVVDNPIGGAYDTSYDIWLSNDQFEIMLWTFETGAIKPISDSYNASGAVPYYTNLVVGGNTWNVYAGPHGTGRTFSFVRTTTANSGTVDLLAIFSWIESISKTNTAFANFSNPVLQDVQFGWEITNTNSVTTNFQCTNYSVTNQ